MISRRWFQTPQLTQWKYMQECGDYVAPFFMFPLVPDWPKTGAIPAAHSEEAR